MSAWSATELAGTRLPEEWYKHSAGLAPAPGQDKVLLMFVGAEGAKYGDDKTLYNMSQSSILSLGWRTR